MDFILILLIISNAVSGSLLVYFVANYTSNRKKTLRAINHAKNMESAVDEVERHNGSLTMTNRKLHKLYRELYNSENQSELRSSHDSFELFIESRKKAEDAIDGLYALINDSGHASLAELYRILKLDSTKVDKTLGWFELEEPYARRVDYGYILNLPIPVDLSQKNSQE